MAHLNLMLRFDNLCQRERVVAIAARPFFYSLCAFWQSSLRSLVLLPKLLAVQLQAGLHFLHAAVVLLYYISGFQQLSKSLLVEGRFVFLLAHDLHFAALVVSADEATAGNQHYFSAISPPKNLIPMSTKTKRPEPRKGVPTLAQP